MRADAYTKAVLTVIALCLVWMCISGAVISPASAAQPRDPMEVFVVGARAPVPISVASPVPVVTAPRTSLVVRPGPEWYADALPVDAPRPLATRLTSVERPSGAGRWDPLDVNVKQQPRKTEPGH